MAYFQVNERCNGCLACVQCCPARALEHRDDGQKRTLLHNMTRCARCATCWRVCPQTAIEFQHLLLGPWDEVITLELERCRVCGEPVHTADLPGVVDPGLRALAEPLCARHRARQQASAATGRAMRGGGIDRR